MAVTAMEKRKGDFSLCAAKYGRLGTGVPVFRMGVEEDILYRSHMLAVVPCIIEWGWEGLKSRENWRIGMEESHMPRPRSDLSREAPQGNY
ncbi:hypothetical protein SUGI_0483440 [Cryptomeria japonica]|nr:hypothetical protein SUGI_0483440 [Cryptomeria japonica]